MVGYMEQTCMNLFMLYLILQFSKKSENHYVMDRVLIVKVPVSVFIQN